MKNLLAAACAALLVLLGVIVPLSVPVQARASQGPQPVSYVFTFTGSATVPFRYLTVPQQDWQVGNVGIDIEQRGYVKISSIGTIYGLPLPLGCEPGVDTHTRWRCSGSAIGVGIALDGDLPLAYPGANFWALGRSSIEPASDLYLNGPCHDPNNFNYLLASELDPPSLYTWTKKSVPSTDQNISDDVEGYGDNFEGTGTFDVAVGLTHDYGIDWVGCFHPYAPVHYREVEITITLYPE